MSRFLHWHASLTMDVVPKRLWTASALFAIIVVSLIMIFSGSLDGAAAWANIIALPVAIVGVVLTIRGPSDRQSPADDQGGTASPKLVEPRGSSPTVSQVGIGKHQYNIAGDFIARGEKRDGK